MLNNKLLEKKHKEHEEHETRIRLHLVNIISPLNLSFIKKMEATNIAFIVCVCVLCAFNAQIFV